MIVCRGEGEVQKIENLGAWECVQQQIFANVTIYVMIENNLVINNSLQAWNDLQILWLVGILAIIRNLHIAMTPLLLCLSDFYPLLGSEMLTEFRESVLGEAETVEEGAVLDWV